jgi:hypothetical protein
MTRLLNLLGSDRRRAVPRWNVNSIKIPLRFIEHENGDTYTLRNTNRTGTVSLKDGITFRDKNLIMYGTVQRIMPSSKNRNVLEVAAFRLPGDMGMDRPAHELLGLPGRMDVPLQNVIGKVSIMHHKEFKKLFPDMYNQEKSSPLVNSVRSVSPDEDMFYVREVFNPRTKKCSPVKKAVFEDSPIALDRDILLVRHELRKAVARVHNPNGPAARYIKRVKDAIGIVNKIPGSVKPVGPRRVSQAVAEAVLSPMQYAMKTATKVVYSYPESLTSKEDLQPILGFPGIDWTWKVHLGRNRVSYVSQYSVSKLRLIYSYTQRVRQCV